jgi:hypothetical protein
LIHRHHPEYVRSPLASNHRKRLAQECEPVMLDRRHDETIRHESHCPLEVEWRRASFRCREHIIFLWPRNFSVELLYLYRDEIARHAVWIESFLASPPFDRGEGLCDSVCNTTKNLNWGFNVRALRGGDVLE